MDQKNKLIWIKITSIIICVILISILLIIPILYDFWWNEWLRDIFPGTDYIWRFITEFGGTYVYYGMFFIFYWGINKQYAKSLFRVYVGSNFVNFYSKALINRGRPDESLWILIGAGHLSTPSGHAMSSSVWWGYIAIYLKKWWMWVTSIIIIILVGLSRNYLGVHWLGDVLTGWLFGMIILLLVLILRNPIYSFLEKKAINQGVLSICGIILAIIILILTEILYNSTYNIGTPCGQLLGMSIGFYVEQKYINFNENIREKKWWKGLIRLILGLILILCFFMGLDLFLSSSVFWQNTLMHMLTLLFGIVFWPLIFQKINI
ncbi:phosphatase PAP2 family protein [Promethearchaeum syntrophicum]|uniref:Phosphatase PAP2 family protein n=1 Tax=Promethearchaeum syntrophicum TaxID=2594042 RepID=A0A5B9DFW0_9ARCH|nr:phosphatase PAP2 family protein [Candidatus Prometheoarchaeum syntrophicum]QEE17670.1 Undecaprenyl-diphosphatase [Candidatus Prometheoarchaeum syntrophicum]